MKEYKPCPSARQFSSKCNKCRAINNLKPIKASKDHPYAMGDKHTHGSWAICNTVQQPDMTVNIYWSCNAVNYCQAMRKQNFKATGEATIV